MALDRGEADEELRGDLGVRGDELPRRGGFVFRGFVMQSIGSWLRHPAFAVVLQIPVFLVLHVCDVWGSLTVVALAAFTGWLAWRTGGRESSIGLHVGNNVSILIAGALGLRDANTTELTPATLGISVAAMLLYTIVVDRWADRIGLVRVRPSSAADQAASSCASRIV